MSRLPKPSRININGEEKVLVEPETYERLQANRRQAGALAAQLQSAKLKMAALAKFLDDLEQTVAEMPCCDNGCALTGLAEPACPRHLLDQELRTRPDHRPNRQAYERPREGRHP